MNKFPFIVLLLASFQGYAQSQDYDGSSEVYLGASLLDFSYKEFDDNGTFLDGEFGLIPGFIIGYKSSRRDIYTDISYRYHSAEIDYDGHTQSGIPVKTDSGADIYELQLKLGSEVKSHNNYKYDFYAGIGYRAWERDIHSTFNSSVGFVSGIYEEYDWTYLMLGAKFPILNTMNGRLDFDIQYTKMIDANIFVKLSPLGGDNVNLALGKENGFRFSFPWRIKYQESSTWVIEPYYESWDIGRSEIKPITVGGVPTGFFILEPRSETRNYGVNVQLVIPF